MPVSEAFANRLGFTTVGGSTSYHLNRLRARELGVQTFVGLAGAAALRNMPFLRGSQKRSHGVMSQSTASFSQASQQSAAKINDVLVSSNELIARKRSSPVSYRLHPAKWLAMDKMLKNLFFPLQRTMLNFGISSFSGFGDLNYDDKLNVAGATLEATQRTRGLYRGLAMFDVRTTSISDTRSTLNTLNAARKPIGEVVQSGGATAVVESYFRRFNNQPDKTVVATTEVGDAAIVNQSSMQTFATDWQVDPTAKTVRSLSMGVNLDILERQSVTSMVYTDPIVAPYIVRNTDTAALEPGSGHTLTNAGRVTVRDDGALDGSVMTSTTQPLGPDGVYYTKVQDGVMRIIDGQIVMDVMNTEQTPCLVEVVIHSKKKTALTKQAIFDQLYNDVDRKLKRRVQNGSDLPSDTNVSGGWQAFYDPKYPLLKTDADAISRRYITEVHRSSHALAPGQSKKISISLGSLWYKLGNKGDTITGDSSTTAPSEFPKVQYNTGSLFVSVGHSGFDYPQSFATNNVGLSGAYTEPSTLFSGGDTSGNFGNYAGTGFWVGKATAPSSISIDGHYTEKFYPMTFDRSVPSCGQFGVPSPAYIQGTLNSNSYDAAVPLATIVPERVQSAGPISSVT